MKLSKVMETDVLYVEVPGNRKLVLKLMKESGHTGIPVVKKGTKKVVGFVSRSNLLKKPNETQIAALMSENITTLGPNQSVAVAVKIIRDTNIRRIPIVENDNLVGILTIGDLIKKAIPNLEIKDPIAPYVKKRVTTIWDHAPIMIAQHVMRFANKQVLPAISESGILTGIISETELIQNADIIRKDLKSAMNIGSEGEKWEWNTGGTLYITKNVLTFPKNLLVKDIMISKIITVNEETSVHDCASKMVELGLDQIPVLDVKGDLMGTIIDIDLIKVLEKKEKK
ncbi:MAG: CBS domain-containing protein [Candidatus Ranarchaeia archaeon]